MSSGNKRMKINTLERAVSTDINRLQAFSGFMLAELLHYMIDGGLAEDDAAGMVGVGASVTSPLRGEIVNGIMPRPEIGTTTLYIDPGVALLVAPDSPPNDDDSGYKVIIDQGITHSGVLAMTTNTSGQDRIDVIECSVNPDVVLESDNRDIYNNSTGLFQAATVDKVTQSELTYRIRAGTPGGGYPGAASGWLPLAVVLVPNGATTWNDCDLWDVRPLMADRVRGPMSVLESNRPIEAEREMEIDVPTLPTVTPWDQPVKLTGNAQLVLGSRYIGGNVGTIAPSYMDLSDPMFTEPSFYSSIMTGITSTIGTKAFYVWFACPLGLPRWARYTPYTLGVRKPMSPRGLPIVSTVGPTEKGAPATALTLPAALGMGAATTVNARLAYAGQLRCDPAVVAPHPISSRITDNWMEIIGHPAWTDPVPDNFLEMFPIMYGGSAKKDTSGAEAWLECKFVLTDGLTHPRTANALKARVGVSLFPYAIDNFSFIATLEDHTGAIYWRFAQIINSLPANGTTKANSFYRQEIHDGSGNGAAAVETITTSTQSGVDSVDVTGLEVGDIFFAEYHTSMRAYQTSSPATDHSASISLQSIEDVGGSNTTTTLNPGFGITGTQHVAIHTKFGTIAHAGTLRVIASFVPTTGTSIDNFSNGGLRVTVFRPSSTKESHILYFPLEVPLKRGAGNGGAQTLRCSVMSLNRTGTNLAPVIDFDPVLSTNPQSQIDRFAMDIVGWRLRP